MRVVAMDGVRSARRILHVSIVPSLPGMSVRSRDINVVTFGGSRAATEAVKLRRIAPASKNRCMMLILALETNGRSELGLRLYPRQ